MGEVYKAKDTRLNRTVAIKVLPAHLSDRPELRERFEREAKAVASLNHPNICTLYDVGRERDTDFLVMEYLDGETLDERLKKGPLPLDQAMRLAADIAGALDKAHRQGIAHRDIKPSNIMFTRSGAKLLDFGLAKGILEAAGATAASDLPTDSGLTAHGAILGTVQYMSPEQLEGREADARSDIFSLGTTFFEAITGQKAFEGKSQASLIAAILEHEPRSISSIQPLTPPLLDRLIRKCLAKDPSDRWQSATDLAEALDWVRDGAPRAASPETQTEPQASRWKTAAIFAGFLFAVSALAFALLLGRRPDNTARWFSVIPPETNFSATLSFALSPDGNHIVFSTATASGASSLWIRSFNSADARELPGTLNARLPFWSPDSRSIAFFTDGKLERIDTDSRSPQILAPAANPRGGSWSADGTIIFGPAPGVGFFKVPASGGNATPLSSDSATHRLKIEAPQFLPDQKHYLYWDYGSENQRVGLYVASLDGPGVKLIPNVNSTAEYSDGYLFFGNGPDLFAQPFDWKRVELTGKAKRVANNLGYFYGDNRHRSFSVSTAGTLAVSSGVVVAPSQLTWFDRSGKRTASLADAGASFGFSVSPDYKRIVLEKIDPQTGSNDPWLIELASGIPSKVVSGRDTSSVIWTSDNERIVYGSARSPSLEIAFVNSGKVEELTATSALAFAQSWSNDGRFLVWAQSAGERSDLWVLPLQGDNKPVPFLRTSFNEFRAQISPDSRWIAYVSDESGLDEVYVDSFPKPGSRKRISVQGGGWPEWRQDGRELYYLAPGAASHQTLMAVKTEIAGTVFSAALPEPLFETPVLGINPRRGQYFAFDNGNRFLMNAVVEETKPRAITVILNWPALLKQ
jgi:serine/threonine protein kinase